MGPARGDPVEDFDALRPGKFGDLFSGVTGEHIGVCRKIIEAEHIVIRVHETGAGGHPAGAKGPPVPQTRMRSSPTHDCNAR